VLHECSISVHECSRVSGDRDGLPIDAVGCHRALGRPAAPEVNRTGAYPRDSVRALGEAGLLGLISAPGVGGGDESMVR
jgi:alkylation response protein AidB-like acyl-CoA dehydrogenase